MSMIKPRHEPLQNLKHEQFARELLIKPSITQAHKATFPDLAPATNRINGSRLVQTNADIRSRVLGLLEESGAGMPVIANRLRHWITQDDHPSVSMDGIKTALKIAGALDPEDSAKNMTNVNIAIGIMSPDGTVNNVTIEG